MAGPFSHIRILDLTRVLAGPWATQNLGDLGAEVIKVEQPGVGDHTRSYGPPYVQSAQGGDASDAVYFLCTNRNKKSVTVDLSTAQGQEVIRRLALQCDVLIENYKVGTLKKYRLSYEDLVEINPRLIYCSLTGFGQDGPAAARPGYDLLFQGMAGLMSITGEPDGAPGAGPQKVGIAVTDVMTGMYAALAISAAISHRDRTGDGQRIDISLLDTMVAFSSNAAITWLHNGIIPQRWGTAHPQIAPYKVFATADGHMILAIGSDSQFASLCRVAGRPELAADERYRLNANRVRNREALDREVSAILRQRTKAEWQTLFDAAGVTCGPINNMKEVFEEPQVVHRELRQDMPHGEAGTVPILASPMRLSRTPVDYRIGPPLLGEHTDAVLRGLLGMDEAEIAALRAAQAI